MTNEIIVRNQLPDFDTVQRQAIALYSSGYFKDVQSKAQAIVKVMAGAELGLPPFASMSGLHIIHGKPVMGSNLIATLVKNDPRYNYQVKQCDNEICVIEWYEDGDPVGEAGFTIAEARAADLATKDNWKKYPSDMLFARAISRGARRFAPGIFGGAPVYVADELGADEDEEGNVIISQTQATAEPPKRNGEIGITPSPEPEQGDFEELETDPAGARPADAAKAAIVAASRDGGTGPATEKQLKYVRSSLSSLFEDDYDKAKLLLVHLFDIDSSKDLTKGQASALIDWVGCREENGWTPTEQAQLEAYRMLREFEVERGQGELPIEEAA